MTEFWLGVVAMLALALAFLCIPFFFSLRRGDLVREQANIQIYKDQLADLKTEFESGRLTEQDYQSLTEEVKRNLLADTENTTSDVTSSDQSGRWIVAVSGVLVVLFSVGLYYKLGAQDELQITQLLKRSFQQDYKKEDAQELIALLENQVKENPKKVESWYMMGRINFDLGEYDKAVLSFNGALTNLPENALEDRATAIAQLAQAQFFANDRKLDKATESLLEEAVKMNPRETTALGLLGIASFESENYLNAIQYWSQLLALMPIDNPNALAIRGGIEKAKAMLTEEELKQLNSETASGARIEVTVNISDAIKSEVPADADLFVMAKAEQGPPMPLAVQRINVKEWPVMVELNDGMAMMPQLKLSQFERVIITARISKSGVGNAKAGDIQGVSQPLDVSAGKVQLAIDEVLK